MRPNSKQTVLEGFFWLKLTEIGFSHCAFFLRESESIRLIFFIFDPTHDAFATQDSDSSSVCLPNNDQSSLVPPAKSCQKDLGLKVILSYVAAARIFVHLRFEQSFWYPSDRSRCPSVCYNSARSRRAANKKQDLSCNNHGKGGSSSEVDRRLFIQHARTDGMLQDNFLFKF